MQLDSTLLASVKDQLLSAGVEYCFATFVDVHGIPKAKSVPIAYFEKMCTGSELFTVGAMEGMGLVGPHEDECGAVPDLNSLVIFPWDHRYAWFSSDMYYHDSPYPSCSRVLLKQVVDKAKKLGFTFNLGVETEFYILRKEGDRYVPFTRENFKGTCPAYDLYLTTESMSVLDPIAKAMDKLGWGLYSFDQEGGHGQYEFDFAYADALTMTDRLIFLRYMLKTLAKSMGAIATFMPKPFSNDFRSAAHFNMSLADIETGKNLFDPSSGQPGDLAARYDLNISDLALHFVAGLLRHAPALTALTCPTFNSYKGLISQGDMPDISWAPILQTYGRNNRSAMLRLPMNRFCIENRAPDMACNPYLAAAFSLAAGLEGIEQKLDPGAPLLGNLYELQGATGVTRLPRTLLESLDAFAIDPLVPEVFGQDFQQIYLTQKMKEWEKGFYRVCDEEREAMITFI